MAAPRLNQAVICKVCQQPTNLWVLAQAQPVLQQLLGTAPPSLEIATMRHRCGSVFGVTVGDLLK